MVVRHQSDSQQDRDVQKQPNDRLFSPLSQNWHIPHPVVDQQEDCNRQQEVQQTPPRYNSHGPTIDYNLQPSFLHLHMTMFTFHQVYNMSTTVNKSSTALFTSHLVFSVNQQHSKNLHNFNNQFLNTVIKMSTNINMATTVHTSWKSTRVNI
ncbi:unnamed protein product [Mytilus coruscus]|uniref:Uncharacterized protein n=1 Tax=Mytilus coruscus TaxID=42192 RepID=A0A6J8EAX9_MYTCO|nr:unnamed protein product [Mytilus coruscus]